MTIILPFTFTLLDIRGKYRRFKYGGDDGGDLQVVVVVVVVVVVMEIMMMFDAKESRSRIGYTVYLDVS
jgi:hypothetical protein